MSVISIKGFFFFFNFLFGRKKGKCLWKWLDLTWLVAGSPGAPWKARASAWVRWFLCTALAGWLGFSVAESSVSVLAFSSDWKQSLCPFSLWFLPALLDGFCYLSVPSLGIAWLIYQEFLHPVFLLEMLLTKTSSCFLSGVSIVSVFWRQTMFLFLLFESSLLFSAYLYHALFWPFWWRDRYHGQRFIPAYRSQSSWACPG